MSFFSFKDTLRLFYPNVLYNDTDTLSNRIAFVKNDAGAIIGVLKRNDNRFTLHKLDTFLITDKTVPLLIGITQGDNDYIKNILGARDTPIAGSTDMSRSGDKPDADVYFHRGILNTNRLTFVKSDIHAGVIENAIKVFLQRKDHYENMINDIKQKYNSGQIKRDMEGYIVNVEALIMDLTTNDTDVVDLQSAFYKESNIVIDALGVLMSLVSKEIAGDGDSLDTPDTADAGFGDVINAIVKMLDDTGAYIQSVIDRRETLKTDLASIDKISGDFDRIRADLEKHHLDVLYFVERELDDDTIRNYNKMRRQLFSEFNVIIQKFETLKQICRGRGTECTRFEQYLTDLRGIMQKQLDEQITKLNNTKDMFDIKRQERRTERQNEIGQVRNLITQRIDEIKTLLELNLSKTTNLGDKVREDALYQYMDCGGLVSQFKEMSAIFVRRQQALDKLRLMIDILCDNPSSVYKDIVCDFTPEVKESFMQKYLDIKGKMDNDATLLGIGDANVANVANEIDIALCTKISDKLLIWTKHWTTFREHESELAGLSDELARFA